MIKQRIDIMCDIETLGRDNSAPVFQIAAIKFNIETGEVFDTFNVLVDISSLNTIEGSTLLWWLQTDKELLTQLVTKGQEDGISEEEAIRRFVSWMQMSPDKKIAHEPKKNEIFLWGNGILFDNRLVKAKCDQYDITYPIFYRNDRDMRTLVELAAIKTGNGSEFEYRSHFEQVGDRHNALDDCKFQVNVLCKAYRDIITPTNTTSHCRIPKYGSAAQTLL